MHQRLIARLQAVSGLAQEELAVLNALPHTVRKLDDRESILREGDGAFNCVVLISGFLYRRKIVGDRSQILSLHVPGDIPDLMTLYLPTMDHDLISVGQSIVGTVPHAALRAMFDKQPSLVHTFWRETLIDAAIFRHWVGNLGALDALHRVAQLFCELAVRLEFVGLLNRDSFAFPLTQADIGSACGLSTVHTNRTLQALRRKGLLEWRGEMVTLPNRGDLEALADFNADYLQRSSKSA
ncbi:Crp/Fnr family transcriptional regulator [Bradyrhizobium erythrophlei]|uniref:cAMP-binding domain of CRP or a regulatory subunit of cAMP-dependent protein kinases n=1 Tax=Bradyrhizobium erythrophlei TaxID=1437360 RepID=A0A1H4XXR5_9BRAD|nr:Crp/Fnr family transcriptional regulator [Bradyrhizobium erythrophlei]SED09950.1 cAMP-binding domain of CRP or a regulatory subunit of cAMP-dependent protein kinases [Bradyrhizobium erythrophlei]